MFGVISLVVGFLFGAAGGLAMTGLANFFSSLGVLLLGLGILKSLASKIEKRLMDVQGAINRNSERELSS